MAKKKAKKPKKKGFAIVITARTLAIGSVALALVAVGALVGFELTSSTAQAHDALLQPANQVGLHPFMPNVGEDAAVHSAKASAGQYVGNSVGLVEGPWTSAAAPRPR